MTPELIKELQVGDWVEIQAHVEYETNNGKREPHRWTKNAIGQVCGVRARQSGVVKGGEYDDPAYLEQVNQEWLILVRLGRTNKPLEVRPEDLTLIRPSLHELPWRYCEQPYWTDEDRKILSDWASGAQRDKKGRFIRE